MQVFGGQDFWLIGLFQGIEHLFFFQGGRAHSDGELDGVGEHGDQWPR